MKVFLFGHNLKQEDTNQIKRFFHIFEENKIDLRIYKPYYDKIKNKEDINLPVWNSYAEICKEKPDFLITLGGDGTILEAVTLVRDSNIPILGINMGRLGFLASIEKKLMVDTVYHLMNGMYQIEERSLIQLECNKAIFGDTPVALNDFTILKRDNSSMITIKTYVNGDFLNAYWADGIIVATPTGSTGYSLSCGGPIIFPKSQNLVITPVAPHNLNVRPVVIPDDAILSFEVEGRTDNFLCTLDSRYEIITAEYQLAIKKCDYNIRLVQLQPVNFLKTIHDKLNWGIDKRN